MTKFVNPMNGYTEDVTGMSGVWAFVFGVFYFMYKGVWRHVLIQMLAGLVLVSLFGAAATVLLIPLWLGYAVFAKSIVEASYQRAGYQMETGAPPFTTELTHLAPKPASDELWAKVLAEFDSPERQSGLWARLLSQSGGDESKAKALYLGERVKQLDTR